MKIAGYDFDLCTGTFENLDRYLSVLASELPDNQCRSEIGKTRQGRGLILMTLIDSSHGGIGDKSVLLAFGNNFFMSFTDRCPALEQSAAFSS